MNRHAMRNGSMECDSPKDVKVKGSSSGKVMLAAAGAITGLHHCLSLSLSFLMGSTFFAFPYFRIVAIVLFMP